MDSHQQTLLTFPTDHAFKVFFRPDRVGSERILQTVVLHLKTPKDLLTTRESASRSGKYRCITIQCHLHEEQQLMDIYRLVRQLQGVSYLL
jgi:putative lipoic acid-binding regulatory protein